MKVRVCYLIKEVTYVDVDEKFRALETDDYDDDLVDELLDTAWDEVDKITGDGWRILTVTDADNDEILCENC